MPVRYHSSNHSEYLLSQWRARLHEVLPSTWVYRKGDGTSEIVTHVPSLLIDSISLGCCISGGHIISDGASEILVFCCCPMTVPHWIIIWQLVIIPSDLVLWCCNPHFHSRSPALSSVPSLLTVLRPRKDNNISKILVFSCCLSTVSRWDFVCQVVISPAMVLVRYSYTVTTYRISLEYLPVSGGHTINFGAIDGHHPLSPTFSSAPSFMTVLRLSRIT